MNEVQRKNCLLLRNMESSEAVDWLISNHPGDGCMYIARRSWKKDDQIKLAERFLKSIPHASATCYKALLSVMSVTRFVSILEKYISEKASDSELLKYYLMPALINESKTEKDQSVIARLEGELQ